MLTTTLDSLSPGETYRLSLDALDTGGGITRTAHSGTITATTTTADFTIMPDSPPPIIVAGAVISESLLLATEAQAFPEQVSLFAGDALPPGFGLTFVPQVITPTIAGAPVSVVISTSTTLDTGDYTLPIVGVGAGVTRTLNLPAMILAPDYSLSASPTPVVLHPGGTASVTIRADGLRGMTDPIRLSLEGAPDGLLHRFEPPSIVPGATSTLVLTSTVLLDPGSYIVHVSGFSRPGVRMVDVPVLATSIHTTYLPLLTQVCCAPLHRAGGQRRLRRNQGLDLPDHRQHRRLHDSQAFSGARSARFGLLPGAAVAAAQPNGPARVEYNLLGEARDPGRHVLQRLSNHLDPRRCNIGNPALLVQTRR